MEGHPVVGEHDGEEDEVQEELGAAMGRRGWGGVTRGRTAGRRSAGGWVRDRISPLLAGSLADGSSLAENAFSRVGWVRERTSGGGVGTAAVRESVTAAGRDLREVRDEVEVEAVHGLARPAPVAPHVDDVDEILEEG